MSKEAEQLQRGQQTESSLRRSATIPPSTCLGGSAGSTGSAMRLSAVRPYQVVMLSLEIERQNVSLGSVSLVQRSRVNPGETPFDAGPVSLDIVGRAVDGPAQHFVEHPFTLRIQILLEHRHMSSAPDRMKTSDSLASSYRGNPLSVLRVIWGRPSDQPSPKGPLPDPES